MFNLMKLQFDITNGCNLNCIHCRNGKIKPEDIQYLSYDQCKDVFLEAKKMGCEWVNICGGEPLIHPHVYDIIGFISQHASVMLLTNGYLINEDVALKLKKANITMVQISIDSAKPQRHDYLRNKQGAFNRIIKAVEALKAENIEVCFMVTLSKYNYEEFLDILEFAKSIGVSFVNFRRLIPQGNGAKNYELLNLSKEDINKILNKSQEYEGMYDIGICLFPFYYLKNKNFKDEYLREPSIIPEGGCSAGVAGLAINYNGDILLCPHIPIVLGNINKTTITNIWNDNELIVKLRNRKNLKGKCGECSYNNICGGCRAYPYFVKDDLFGEDSLCVI